MQLAEELGNQWYRQLKHEARVEKSLKENGVKVIGLTGRLLCVVGLVLVAIGHWLLGQSTPTQ